MGFDNDLLHGERGLLGGGGGLSRPGLPRQTPENLDDGEKMVRSVDRNLVVLLARRAGGGPLVVVLLPNVGVVIVKKVVLLLMRAPLGYNPELS